MQYNLLDSFVCYLTALLLCDYYFHNYLFLYAVRTYGAQNDGTVFLYRKARKLKKPHSLGYHGNVVDLW